MSNINQFNGCRKFRLACAPHKKTPPCVFEWRDLLRAAAARVFFRGRGKASTHCD